AMGGNSSATRKLNRNPTPVASSRTPDQRGETLARSVATAVKTRPKSSAIPRKKAAALSSPPVIAGVKSGSAACTRKTHARVPATRGPPVPASPPPPLGAHIPGKASKSKREATRGRLLTRGREPSLGSERDQRGRCSYSQCFRDQGPLTPAYGCCDYRYASFLLALIAPAACPEGQPQASSPERVG